MKTMSRLLHFILPVWRWLLLAVGLGALTIASSIALLATSAYLISAAALHPSIAELQVAIVGVRFFGLSRGVFRYLERLTSHETTFRLLGRLRVWFYGVLEPLAPARLGGERSGDLLSRFLADIETLENFYVRVLAPPLVALVILAGTGLFMAGFDVRLSALLLATLLLVGVGLTWLSLVLGRKPGQVLVEAKASLQADLVDGLQGLPDLLVYDGLPAYFGRLDASQTGLLQAQHRMAAISALQSALNQLLTGLGTWLVLVLGILLVSTGQLPGIYLAVIVLAAMASFEAVQGLPLAAQYLESNLQAARRLFAMADTPPAVLDIAGSQVKIGSADLTVEDLGFTYPGTSSDPPTLSDIHFELPVGKHIAILGVSGSGKSTLFQVLLRFWEMDAGEITLAGLDVHQFTQESVRQCFSVLPQNIYLFNTSLRENLLVADPAANPGQIGQALSTACLDEFVASLPQGLETLVGERGLQLSGGERQRLGLARLLLKHSPIYLLDEPTAQMDTLLEARIIRNLQTALQGHSLLWITQRLVGLEWMDEILVMQAGRISQRGTHAELIGVDGLYKQMWLAHNDLFALQDS
ncbi:MAG: thiol reductant ABC exporter subunit CydC [Chloroflexi bacterium GWB2_49_20]|nr:MAG: thiol reductant ABC exporter subunit CydC [Chloroflexi bacterium GWB2_49_20]OGN79221.1 MAG: thiol reductant ABC exporter subunit CydC [Chloroflexi bacterium GWC2_49_37]OGN83009.1 MAG: thiol reductant ABC exporter subunit CydC [Chloroflexi bacterium GWD2_49_16]HCC78669.1 thiol reductant ABC exporter subunit CydC [Anaerolineae bacterium]